MPSYLPRKLPIPPHFCLRIPNPEPEIREIPDPKKPIDDPLHTVALGKEVKGVDGCVNNPRSRNTHLRFSVYIIGFTSKV